MARLFGGPFILVRGNDMYVQVILPSRAVLSLAGMESPKSASILECQHRASFMSNYIYL
jgi:hypothetical protein